MDRVVAMRIISRLESLAQDPRPVGCAKLEGTVDLWRVRVGDYRIIYAVDDRARTVDVSVVRHRRVCRVRQPDRAAAGLNGRKPRLVFRNIAHASNIRNLRIVRH